MDVRFYIPNDRLEPSCSWFAARRGHCSLRAAPASSRRGTFCAPIARPATSENPPHVLCQSTCVITQQHTLTTCSTWNSEGFDTQATRGLPQVKEPETRMINSGCAFFLQIHETCPDSDNGMKATAPYMRWFNETERFKTTQVGHNVSDTCFAPVPHKICIIPRKKPRRITSAANWLTLSM